MDWLKLFALLIAVASVHIEADVPKKKILIHLPQKVKHIHHHKKIYITEHPASSNYAPAFMPNAEGAVAVATNIQIPAVESLETYDEPPMRLPGISSAASKLLSLYRARGYYGPPPSEWDEQDYEFDNSEESTDDSYLAATAAAPKPKRVKIINLNKEASRKPIVLNNKVRKNKPKRAPIRHKTLPEMEGELPVTTFHEQFYSDLDGSGTIKTVKKPQRVEKIIDGDTEHIHTYSEEHIHKLVYNNPPKIPRVVGIDPSDGLPALVASRPMAPTRNQQTVIAFPSNAHTKFHMGPVGSPSQTDYNYYNPRDVTHDHVFHDHGEIPPGMDITKNHMSFPPRTYSSQNMKFGGNAKGTKSKNAHKYTKHYQKPSAITDLSYYEQVYAPFHKYRNAQKPQSFTSYEPSNEEDEDDYRPVMPSFKLKHKGASKPRNLVPALYFGHGKQSTEYKQQQASESSPYSVSATIVHDYKPRHYLGQSQGLSKFNNIEYDTYAASSNIHENYPKNFPVKKAKQKSESRQNTEELNHMSTVDHLIDSAIARAILNGGIPSAFENNYEQTKQEKPTSKTLMIKETSPVHNYYSTMAKKALNDEDRFSVGAASNNNYQYLPAPSPTPTEPVAVTSTSPSPPRHDVTISEPATESTNFEIRYKGSNEKRYAKPNINKEHKPRFKVNSGQNRGPSKVYHENDKNHYNTDPAAGKLKYGDKI